MKTGTADKMTRVRDQGRRKASTRYVVRDRINFAEAREDAILISSEGKLSWKNERGGNTNRGWKLRYKGVTEPREKPCVFKFGSVCGLNN